MDYFPNQQAATFFCDEVFPLIHQRRPTARFAIIGAEPSRAIRRLGQRPGITVTGTVPDVRDPVRRAADRVAPQQGRAQGRERVWKYVEITVGAGSIKKNIKESTY